MQLANTWPIQKRPLSERPFSFYFLAALIYVFSSSISFFWSSGEVFLQLSAPVIKLFCFSTGMVGHTVSPILSTDFWFASSDAHGIEAAAVGFAGAVLETVVFFFAVVVVAAFSCGALVSAACTWLMPETSTAEATKAMGSQFVSHFHGKGLKGN